MFLDQITGKTPPFRGFRAVVGGRSRGEREVHAIFSAFFENVVHSKSGKSEAVFCTFVVVYGKTRYFCFFREVVGVEGEDTQLGCKYRYLSCEPRVNPPLPLKQ